MRFIYINDGVPKITTQLLSEACAARKVEMAEIDAPGFLFAPESELAPGDLLYRSATSLAAMRVEQFLYGQGVASFYNDLDAGLGSLPYYALAFQRAGIPVPRSIPVGSTDRDLLRSNVSAVGGFPVIVKIPGGSGGIGTLRVDTFGGLFSLIDFLLDRGIQPLLCAFIDNAVHWRVIVVGNSVAAAYRNVQDEDDFRTFASDDLADFKTPPPGTVASIALRGVQALRLEFGGVDVLEHASGRIYLLEVNFPCFFADPQRVAGIDVAGMMIEHLIAKSRKLSGCARE
jgi:hypothetical protein